MKIKLWPADADTLVEKILYVAMYTALPFAFLFLNLSAWGIFKNCYQETVSKHGFGDHLFGFVLCSAAVVAVIAMKNDLNVFLRLGLKWNTVGQIAVGILAALGLLAYSGFSWWFNVCQ